jgi:hypothetical protein
MRKRHNRTAIDIDHIQFAGAIKRDEISGCSVARHGSEQAHFQRIRTCYDKVDIAGLAQVGADRFDFNALTRRELSGETLEDL